MPYLLLAALTALLPVVRVIRVAPGHRRCKRVAAGRCPQCGYDLRATPGKA